MYYSVPYEYIKQLVDIRVTKNVVEIFFKNFRIASHKRLYGKAGQASTIPEHMPENHKRYIDFNRDSVLEWASKVGTHTLTTVKSILASYKIEKQGLKSCLALMKLADKHSVECVESACKRALEYTPRPTLKSIQTILKTGQDKLSETNPSVDNTTKNTTSSYGFTRGAAYYGGKNNDK